MNTPTNPKQFIFNQKIDKAVLNSLYEDDYPYMEEIFSITLAQLKPDLTLFKLAFQNADMNSLRQAVHKIKPSFGFVGLPDVQDSCKQFEDLCLNAANIDELKTEYASLCNQLDDAWTIIETEYIKFKEFNQA